MNNRMEVEEWQEVNVVAFEASYTSVVIDGHTWYGIKVERYKGTIEPVWGFEVFGASMDVFLQGETPDGLGEAKELALGAIRIYEDLDEDPVWEAILKDIGIE